MAIYQSLWGTARNLPKLSPINRKNATPFSLTITRPLAFWFRTSLHFKGQWSREELLLGERVTRSKQIQGVISKGLVRQQVLSRGKSSTKWPYHLVRDHWNHPKRNNKPKKKHETCRVLVESARVKDLRLFGLMKVFTWNIDGKRLVPTIYQWICHCKIVGK